MKKENVNDDDDEKCKMTHTHRHQPDQPNGNMAGTRKLIYIFFCDCSYHFIEHIHTG